jgi:hypothetical protein
VSADAVVLGDLAFGVGKQGEVEAVAVGEAALGCGVVAADPEAGRSERGELGTRSRKWQLSAVQPGLIAAG